MDSMVILRALQELHVDDHLRQALDSATRQYSLDGTNTMLNDPPSANTTLDDVIDLTYAA